MRIYQKSFISKLITFSIYIISTLGSPAETNYQQGADSKIFDHSVNEQFEHKTKKDILSQEIFGWSDDTSRREELPDWENQTEDLYPIIEESEDCDWCNNPDLVESDFVDDDDDEFRKPTVYTYNEYIAPGTCVTNKSPRHPKKYKANEDHRYYYTTHQDSTLKFTVKRGDIQGSTKCKRDILKVRIGTENYIECYGFKDFTVDSATKETNEMYVRFKTNHRINRYGYTGTICAAEVPSTTTTTTTTSTTTTTTVTLPEPVLCDDVCGDLTAFSSRLSMPMNADPRMPHVVIVDIIGNDVEVIVRATGNIISPTHITTAAFPFYQEGLTGVDDVTVRVTAGVYDLTDTREAQIIYTTNITLYPDFDADNGGGAYNYAVITLPGEGLTLNVNVAPICLANTTVQAALVTALTNLKVTGFGWTESDYPAINMTTITLRTCPFIFPNDLICIYLVGATQTPCHGDSGAAIYEMYSDNRYYAVAQVNAVTIDTCPVSGSVNPSPAVAYFLDWTNEVTGVRYC